MTEFVMI